MTTGVPWEVAGVRPQARETAREAARRSGMSIGEWLDTLILERARHEGVAPAQRPYDDPEHYRRPSDERRDEPLAAVSERLAMLSRKLDQLSHGSAPAAPPVARPHRDDATSREIADALSRIDHRLNQFAADHRSPPVDLGRHSAPPFSYEPPRPAAPPAPVSPLDQALAEIAERQRMLDGESAPSRADLPRAPTQGLTALEAQLRQINARIDTLQPCGISSAVETLRDDLAEIGLMIKEAMPRQAIEALETEVRALAQRVDSKRNDGANAADLAGIERGLAEVRDALLALTPAENLVGYDETVRAMSQKIDSIASVSHDPAALEQLESAIVGLRGIVSHVASNEALGKLSDEVRALAERVDQIVGADVLAAIEQRIGLIADALEARPQAAGAAASAPSPELEAVMQGIAAKLEGLQLSRGDQAAVSHLEDRIAKLVEKLDSSDARFGHLESIERGLTDLLVFLEQQQRAQEQHAQQPVRSEPVSFPEVDTLKRDVQRTQDSIEAVHGTLGHVVDRLALIEDGIRSASTRPVTVEAPAKYAPPPAPPAEPPCPPPAAATMPASPVIQAQPAPAAPATMGNPAPGEPRPIDPDLPPDHPIEPGATRSRGGNSPADRIAASEAALGPTRPPVIPDPGGKANFIAAARRAAQAANTGEPSRGDKQQPAPRSPRLDAKPASKLRDRVRMLLVGASVVMIVLGSLQLATGLFSGSDHTVTPPPEEVQPFQSGTINAAPAPAEAPASPPPQPTTGRQSAVLPGGATFPSPNAGVLLPAELATPVAAPKTPEPVASADRAVTGSIRQPSLASAATTPTPAPAPAPAADKLPPGADKLPAGLGSPALRAAAVKGDPAAEFEVAVRYADGRGVPQDLSAAVEWFERAAKQGLPPAQFRLGGLYEKGMGVKKDADRARRLYLSAAQAGNAKAMHNLAVLYAEGVDGKPDYLTAAKWFRQAAGYGVSDSQYNLGILYARGIGVEVNLAEAFKWFSLAAREGDRDAAKKRDDVGARLDQQTVMAARAAVQVWTAEPQPEAATQVKTPPGGWDNASAAATPKRRVGPETKAPRATP